MRTALVVILSFIPLCWTGCPPNYEIINNICFGLRTAANMDWEQADKLCHDDHTRLARVEPEQMPELLKVLPRGARAWIGLRFDKVKHKWIWAKDHSSADLGLVYLAGLDPNATEEDDCAVIRMKKNVLSIEADTCTDKWVTSALCSMEKESCGYSMTRDFGDCEFEGNQTCYKKSEYDVDGGFLPRHLDSCQVDSVDCRVALNGTYTDGVACQLICGDNADIDANASIVTSADCKRVTVGKSCDCQEAVEASARAASRNQNRLGLYIGISMLAAIVAILIIGTVGSYIHKRRKQHSERIHPPSATVTARPAVKSYLVIVTASTYLLYYPLQLQ